MKKKTFQVIIYNRNTGDERLDNWFFDEEDAENYKKEQEDMFDGMADFRIEPGADWITSKCKGCQDVECEERLDWHGITTGYWCNSCYNSPKYPYRKDRYPTQETQGYGDHLNPEEY